MGEILEIIELCGLVAQLGQKAYEIASKVATNFEGQRKSLAEKVEKLRQRVDLLGMNIDKYASPHSLTGLKAVLEDIKAEFENISNFFQKLRRYDDLRGLKKLVRRLKNFWSVQSRFDDFDSILEELDEELTKNVPDGILETVLQAKDAFHDFAAQQKELLEKQKEALKYQHDDHEKIIQLLQNDDDLKKNMMILKTRQTFMDKRASELFLIEPSELSEKKFLAEGSFCTYSTAVLDHEQVILKEVRDVRNPVVIAQFARETRNLLMFSRGSIVRVFGMWDGEDKKYLVMEHMHKGTLAKVLQEETNLSLEDKICLALTASKSLYRIHTKLVHTAMRTEKFLVDKDYTAKLCAMGYARTFSSCKRYVGSSNQETLFFYRAPELYTPNFPSKEADIYGFGIVLWEIFTQKKPFSSVLGENPTKEGVKKFLFEDKKEEYELSMLQDPVKDRLSDLVRRCRSFNPEDRPNISYIVESLTKISDDYHRQDDQ